MRIRSFTGNAWPPEMRPQIKCLISAKNKKNKNEEIVNNKYTTSKSEISTCPRKVYLVIKILYFKEFLLNDSNWTNAQECHV